MSKPIRKGYLSPPTESLATQLRLLQLVLEGMAKHKGEADYPSVLDTYGVQALHDTAADKATAASAAKALFHRAAAEAVAERSQVTAWLEKIQAQLVAAYGKRNPALLDYGFRPVEKRVVHRKATAEAAKGHKKSGTAAGTGGAAAGEPSKGTTPPPSSGSPGA